MTDVQSRHPAPSLSNGSGTPILEVAIAKASAGLFDAPRPFVVRGLAADWPAVRAADILDYLEQSATMIDCDLLEGGPETVGRFFYNEQVTGFNFSRHTLPLQEALTRVRAAALLVPGPTRAIQALPTNEALPQFSAANPAPLLLGSPSPRLWIGNAAIVAAHQDQYRNLAIVVAGRRRFTLFPPDQAANLYLGPLEFSPAGTPISMVNGRSPDLHRFPRYRDAAAVAQVATLGPGDAIFIPYMWWHQVEALSPIGVLANYWWSETAPPQPGLAPVDVLMHARLAFSAMTAEQRAAWQPLFDHIVFVEAEPDYLPPDRRGIRGRIGDLVRTRMRRQLGGLMQR